MRRRFWATLAGFVSIAAFSAVLSPRSHVSAAPPWEHLLTSNRVEADPENEYRLGEDNGPWMIMASSFSGDGAEQQAHELVLELRSRYKLEAFVHEMQFELGAAAGKGIDKYGKPLQWKYRRGDELREIAVLVGNYPAVDDPQAEKTLAKIKYSRPKCLELAKGEASNQTLGALRNIQKSIWKVAGSEEKKDKGPMGHAFIAPNPLLPKEAYVPQGIDPLVVKMNKNLEYSLLDCPGKFTVQVATFTGKIVTDQAEIMMIEKGGKRIDGSQLEKAARKANRLAKALRLKGWEAYVLHERCASIVTVGSFNSVGVRRPDGKIEMDPRVHNIIKTFKAKNLGTGFSPQTLVGIPFDIQPRPVKVPKRSVAAANPHGGRGIW